MYIKPQTSERMGWPRHAYCSLPENSASSRRPAGQPHQEMAYGRRRMPEPTVAVMIWEKPVKAVPWRSVGTHACMSQGG